jgi:carboxymethylenebutenolidase
VEVTIPCASTGPFPAFVVLPDGATRGVVVIHEIWGRMPEIDAVAAEFAGRGYAAVAPDLFHSGFLRCVSRAMRDLPNGKGPQFDQLAAAREYLVATGVKRERVGVIGFCLGGAFALAVGRGWGAVSANYGLTPKADLLRGIGPVIACYGELDRGMGREPDKLRERCAQVGVTPEIHVMPGAGHSFLTQGTHPMMKVFGAVAGAGYREPQAREAWAKIHAFFDRELGAA